MRLRNCFKNPEEVSDSDELIELEAEDIEEFGVRMVAVAGGMDNVTDGSSSELENAPDPDYAEDEDEDDSDDSFDPNATDSDESMDDNSNLATSKERRTRDENDSKPGCSNSVLNALDAEEEDDDTIRAMISAIKKERTAPPEIKLDDFITDLCFHPERDIIALATVTGDVLLYNYSNESNTLLRTIEVHAKACRDVEFSADGHDLLTCSKDKSIMITDMETEKLKKFYETAHDDAINKLFIVDEHLFATGDDSGTVKLWDLRTKDAIFALKEVEDYITQILTNDAKKLLLVTSGDGYLTTLNIGARKLYVQSEPYEEELNCMGLFRGDSKLIVGTSKGRLYTFNWGQFGYHCDMYPGIKTPISQMIPITDRIFCVAGEEGIIRACHVAPFRNLGVVGQHSMPIECMDVSTTGELIASTSHNNDVHFWNVKYFEDFGDIKYNEKHNTFKEKKHNLPSSKFSNASDFFSELNNVPSDSDD